MAPEGLNKDSRELEKTDLYSFAITTLFLLFPTEIAIKLLFLPISEGLEKFRSSLPKLPLLRVIFDTLVTDPHERPGFGKWRNTLQQIKKFDDNWLTGKITREVLENIGIDLHPMRLAEEREMGAIVEILQYFDFDVGSERVNANEVWPMSAAVSHSQKLTLQTLNNQRWPNRGNSHSHEFHSHSKNFWEYCKIPENIFGIFWEFGIPTKTHSHSQNSRE